MAFPAELFVIAGATEGERTILHAFFVYLKQINDSAGGGALAFPSEVTLVAGGTMGERAILRAIFDYFTELDVSIQAGPPIQLGTGNPNGNNASTFKGETYLDEDNQQFYRSTVTGDAADAIWIVV